MEHVLRPALLGLVSGAAHFLPVSATAHQTLLPWMLQWPAPGPAFAPAVLLGAALALCVHLWAPWLRLAAAVRRPGPSPDKKLFWGVTLASLPGYLAGFVWRDILSRRPQPDRVALALIAGGLILYAADRFGRKDRDAASLGWGGFLAIGAAQVLAVIPGLSSIGVALTAALVLGLRRGQAGEAALLLLGAMVPGTALLGLSALQLSQLDASFWLALAGAGIGGHAALLLLRYCLETRDLTAFAVYRVGLGLLALLLSTASPPVRSARELKLTPPPRAAAAALPPRAARLRGRVQALAADIGERSLVRREQKQLNQARDYVAAQFRACGWQPVVEPYQSRWLNAVRSGTTFYNLAVTIGDEQAAGGLWVLGAHYDSAANTLGADDNASGVAVLLELACALKARPPAVPVRLVAYSTEEPPAFATKGMGSAHDARRLRERGVRVAGMVSLEMLGYYDPRPGSQIFFPFLKWITPSEGDFLALVSNWPSRAFLKKFKRAWRRGSDFPLVAVALPEMDAIRPSDHASYWDEGFPALLLTDTSSYRNPHYHEMSDTVDTLDYEAMVRVTDALLAVLYHP